MIAYIFITGVSSACRRCGWLWGGHFSSGSHFFNHNLIFLMKLNRTRKISPSKSPKHG